VGAVFSHLVVIGGNPAPVLVLVALSLVVLLLRRRKLLASVGADVNIVACRAVGWPQAVAVFTLPRTIPEGFA